MHSADAGRAPSASTRRKASSVYLRDGIYGGIDGAITTLAIIAGARGADLGSSVVLVLGVANLFADGLSMAAGNYLGTQAELQQQENERADGDERRAARVHSKSSRLRVMLEEQGVSAAVAQRAAEQWTSCDQPSEAADGWGRPRRAFRAGATTFVAFCCAGTVPLLPFLLAWGLGRPLDESVAFIWSASLTAVAFFGIGAIKALVVRMRWWRAGVQTLAIGGVAAAVAFVIGDLLQRLV